MITRQLLQSPWARWVALSLLALLTVFCFWRAYLLIRIIRHVTPPVIHHPATITPATLPKLNEFHLFGNHQRGETTAEESTAYTLIGVYTAGDQQHPNSVVIIADSSGKQSVYKQGDAIGTAVIYKITSGSVILEQNKKLLALKLATPHVKVNQTTPELNMIEGK